MHSVLDAYSYYEVNVTNLDWDWRNEIIDYLEHGKLPKDPKASRALCTKATQYSFKGGQLYRRSFQGQLAQCLGASEANYVMREVHEGIYGNHSGADSLVEVGPYQKIGEHEVVDFLWENMICKFGIPKEIACENEPQFIGAKIKKFLEDLKIRRITSSPYHLSANGQAESTNKVIILNLKKILEAAKGKWFEELPSVLWAYRTMAKPSTGETPFSLVYELEALIPVEVGEPTLRYFRANKKANNKSMLINLELFDERRDLAHKRIATQKHRIERHYNRRANFRYFEVADLVLRKVTQNTRELSARKLGPTWQGPYRVSVVTGKGS
uniref:Uncharacterized protein LOC104234539 n=1 Tax=Nicotiana sylvestris TaxID=4096 RepID=A0A1U7XHI8_NICSY|nr:PREDICTED: uncharacterized protein LOC104234539 [Nicotiana sylvestris]